MLAFNIASVNLTTLAVSRSKTQSSTPFSVVLVNAILVSSGDHAKFVSFGLSGRPDTCSTAPLLFFSYLIFTVVRLCEENILYIFVFNTFL